MSQGQSQLYSPLNTSGDDDEIAFATTSATATSGMSTITPPSYADNYSYASSSAGQGQEQGPPSSSPSPSLSVNTFLGSQLNSITDVEKQTLVMAKAIPDTIRPPQLDTKNARNAASNKIVRQISILFSGLIICSISAFDAFVFLEFDWGNKFLYVPGFLWLCSTISLLVGTFYGAYVGQWRMLAPGIVLSHVASFMLRMVM